MLLGGSLLFLFCCSLDAPYSETLFHRVLDFTEGAPGSETD